MWDRTNDETLEMAADLVSTPSSGANRGLVPGDRIGPYEIVREIGRGGMAEVYHAARADDLSSPYRHTIVQFYEGSDGINLRTFELRWREDEREILDGMGAVPQAFPTIAATDLLATLDLSIDPTSDGFTGQTPHPYPTGMGGAVSMTSTMRLSGDTLQLTDTGFGPNGSTAWGGEEITLERTDPVFEVKVRSNELIVIDMIQPDGPTVADGDTLHVHYSGWIRNGFKFDSSYDRDTVFRFAYPPRLIQGWNVGLDGVTTGFTRKLVIPGNLGYGPRGNQAARIPPNAPLYFEIDVQLVEKAGQPAPGPEMPGAGG